MIKVIRKIVIDIYFIIAVIIALPYFWYAQVEKMLSIDELTMWNYYTYCIIIGFIIGVCSIIRNWRIIKKNKKIVFKKTLIISIWVKIILLIFLYCLLCISHVMTMFFLSGESLVSI